jgi:hypothetical protein
MYGIACKLCGWSEAAHDGGEIDPCEAHYTPIAGYELPLMNQEGIDHGFVPPDPVFEQRCADTEKLGMNPDLLIKR